MQLGQRGAEQFELELEEAVRVCLPNDYGCYLKRRGISEKPRGVLGSIPWRFFRIATGFFSDYSFSHLSSQPKKVRCHNTPFWGFSTQWFSSG